MTRPPRVVAWKQTSSVGATGIDRESIWHRAERTGEGAVWKRNSSAY